MNIFFPLRWTIRNIRGLQGLGWSAVVACFLPAAFGDTLLSTTSYSFTSTAQSYTTPANTNYIVIKVWGAGGGSGIYGYGGGGAFAKGTFTISSGQGVTVVVGGAGGGYCSGSGGWPDGGGVGDHGGAQGGGGGSSFVYTGSFGVWAGGGGGGCWGLGGGDAGGPNGGGGGGDSGGGGATQSGGGAGGDGGVGVGTDGGYNGGGYGADNGADQGGAGGGGGYFGGGGGGLGDPGGGGGGASYIWGGPTSYSYLGGGGGGAGGTSDPSYPGGYIGFGAPYGVYVDGNNGYVVIQAYQITTAPTITSTGTQNVGQNQSINFTITTTGTPSPSSYGASSLPPGLSVNTSTGHITGNPTTAGTYNSTISATNSVGTGSASVTWVVTAASIVTNASVSPGVLQQGQSLTIYRDGTCNFGVAYCETVVWKPDGTYDYLGVQSLGNQTYSPGAGIGTYSIQFRLVDNYYNYRDQWFTFDVTPLVHTLPYSTSFETSQSFTVGSLHAQQGWVVPLGSANVSTDQAQSGSNGIKLNPGTQLADVKKYFSQSQNWAFVDVYARPVATTAVADSSIMDYGSSRIGFVTSSGQGAIWAYDGNGNGTGTWIDTNVRFAIDGSGQSTQWIRLTVRHDYSAHTWDLYVNGVMAEYDFGMVSNTATSFTDLNWWGHATATAYFDNFTASTTNPLFTDADHDGMPDAWETAHGLNATVNDRNGDLDGDGLTNIEEYFLGSDPNNADRTPPSPPASFFINSTAPTSLGFSWSAAVDTGSGTPGIAGYNLYRNGVKLNSSLLTSRSYTDSGLSASTSYTYTVTAVDLAGNVSSVSAPFTLSTIASSTSGTFEIFTPLP